MPLEIDILCSSGCSFNLLDVPFEAGLQGSSQITLLLKDDNSVWVLTPAEDDFSSPPFYGYLNMRTLGNMHHSECLILIYASSNWAFCVHLDARLIYSMLPSKLDCRVQVQLPPGAVAKE
ncbi:hypothetical protein CEXT_511661 [Caerostris extrusa]|uniref:Uncharacterized protein n=1 Tax=Caerostris extrusa TaxID=172846 RepID=A0AAV4N4I2_CAEEX|nr:hypothetical protein CEXT_511661 [Caerostris extrusa]